MRKNCRIFVCFVLGLILIFTFPLLGYAHSPSPRRNVSVETRWGYYVFDSSKFEESIFGRKYGITGAAKVNLDLFREYLQVGLGIGYMREHEPKYYLYNIPIEASVNFRLKSSPQQFVVPYIGGGLDYSYFKQKGRFIPDPNNPEPGAIHVNRTGYHVNAGFQFLLNILDPEVAGSFDKKFGVNATYLTLEARYTDLKNFGSLGTKEDHSGWFYYMGLLFEF